jgi:hypothetical protein
MSQICEKLHRLFNALPRHRFSFDEHQIPHNGIYFLFEEGECAHGLDRIVRVGTHNGVNQLCSRLKQHFLQENKDRSIFRKNVGRALLNKSNDPSLEQWDWDLTSRKAKEQLMSLLDVEKQRATERAVSEYIQKHFSFVVFRVDDKGQRLHLEKRLISSISLCEECKPSTNWLGLHSPIEKIRKSGLWLVNELYGQELSPDDLEMLGKLLTGYQWVAADAAPLRSECG